MGSQASFTFATISACCIFLKLLLKPVILGGTLCWHQKSFKWAFLDKEFKQKKACFIISKFRTEPVGPQDPRQRLTWNMLVNTEKIWNFVTIWVRYIFWKCFWNQWFWGIPFVDTKKASNEHVQIKNLNRKKHASSFQNSGLSPHKSGSIPY